MAGYDAEPGRGGPRPGSVWREWLDLDRDAPAVRVGELAVLDALDLLEEVRDDGAGLLRVAERERLVPADDLPHGRHHDGGAARGDLGELLQMLTKTKNNPDITTDLREAINYADMVVQYVNDGSGTRDLIDKALKLLCETMNTVEIKKSK